MKATELRDAVLFYWNSLSKCIAHCFLTSVIILSVVDVRAFAAAPEVCNSQASFTDCRKAAEAGSLPAIVRLGEIYRDGTLAKKDLSKARFWFDKAARRGDAAAMNDLGMLYAFTRGIPTDNRAALDWFRRSADKGNAEAMNNLGMMYLEARGVARDYAEAKKWFENGAGLDNATAIVGLGYLYHHGLGIAKDTAKARELYERAATLKSGVALTSLGVMYQNGEGVSKDLEKARGYFEQAAERNFADAMLALGQLYEGGANGLPRDPAKAKYWYELAASKADSAQTHEWASEWAMELLGGSYESGRFTERNYQTALNWFKKAAEVFNSPNAMDRIADFYKYGYGVPKNETEAGKWRAKAAALRPPPKPVTPDCSDRDLQEKLRIFVQPGFEVAAWEIRNKSATTCRVRNYELRPNEIAHSSRRWSTISADGTTSACHSEMDNSHLGKILLVSPTLLTNVRSAVQFSDYAAGPFLPDWPSDNTAVLPPVPKLVLSTPKSEYMQGEYVPLRVNVDSLDAATPKTKHGCPVFFRAITHPTGLIRIDEVTPATREPGGYFSMAVNCQDAAFRGMRRHEFEFDGDQYFDQKASNAVSFFTLAGSSPQGEIRLVESNSTTIAFKDPAEMPRKWGTTELGARVALTLDRLNYAIGEDIPLHIAAQVVSADRPVYAVPDSPQGAFFLDSSTAFHLTIFGEDGIITGNEDAHNLQRKGWGGSSGPTVCPSPMQKDKVLTFERSAKLLGLLPTRPGTYRLVVTWSPYQASDPPCNLSSGSHEPGKIRNLTAVSSAPITIRVTGKPIVELGVPDIPVYTGWRQHFRVVDTPLGEATALEDMRSRLQWLRLTFTKLQSKDSLQKQMAPGERLAGWRFATREELRKFFANFTGTEHGFSQDPAIERALQHLLGGPLDTPRNAKTGLSRRATYAMIAEVRPAGPGEGPAHPAVPKGATPPCGTYPPCETYGYGFVTYFAYIAEDTVHGHINATVDPNSKGWSSSDNGVNYGGNSAILLVRDTP